MAESKSIYALLGSIFYGRIKLINCSCATVESVIKQIEESGNMPVGYRHKYSQVGQDVIVWWQRIMYVDLDAQWAIERDNEYRPITNMKPYWVRE